MITDSRFVIIAGTARNVGKTTLVCQLIESFSDRNIIALKFITLKKNGFNHSHHQDVDTFRLTEEKALDSEKDTVKMLKSGAQRSFMLVSLEKSIPEALDAFLATIDDNDLIIVESATLRKYLKPVAFIIVDRKDAEDRKLYIPELIPLADHLISDVMDYKSLDLLLQSLKSSI